MVSPPELVSPEYLVGAAEHYGAPIIASTYNEPLITSEWAVEVSRRCEELSEVVLISGGNDFTDGSVQVYVRQGDRDITLPLTRFHPEIADPKDKSPAEMSCEELAQEGAPQLLFTNLGVACAMLNAFYAWRSGRLRYGEVYLDIVEGRAQPVARAPRDGENDR